MTEKTSGAKSPITLRRVLPIAAALFLFVLVFVAPTAAEPTTTALDLTTLETVDNIATDGWSWDKDSKTLTLKGLNLVTDATPAITVPAGTMIILADGSVNSITTTAASGRGIECAGSLTVKTADNAVTKGTLNIKTGASGRGIIYRIDRTEVPTAADVDFTISNVVLTIDAQRGIENTFDRPEITDGSNFCRFSITLKEVEFTHTATNVNRIFSLYNSKGSAAFSMEDSTLNGVGDIYVYGAGTNSETTTNIINSKLTITGIVYAGYNGSTIVATVCGSTITAKQLKVGKWGAGATSAQLNVDGSTLTLGPVSGSGAAIEVGENGATTSKANLKNSNIIAVNPQQSAISVSCDISSEDKNQYSGNTWTTIDSARGSLTIEKCTIFFVGKESFGDLDKGSITDSKITNIISASISPDDYGNILLTLPAGTKVNTNGETYTVPEDSAGVGLTINPETGVMTAAPNAEFRLGDGSTISSDGGLGFELGKEILLPADKETTITPAGGDAIKITPTENAPLKRDDNGNIEIPAGAYVQIGENGEKQTFENGGVLTGGAIYSIGTIAEQTYNGTALEPEITVTKNGAPFQDFTVTYENNIKAGTEATAIVKVDNKEIGRQNFVINPKNISGAEIILGSELTYTGEPLTQTITSVIIDELIVTEYDVSDNVQTDVGTYTLKVTGKNNFTGTATKEWSIKEQSGEKTGVLTEAEKAILEQKIKGDFKSLFEGKTVFYVDIVYIGANGLEDHLTVRTFTVPYPSDSGITATNFGNYNFVVIHLNETTAEVEQVQSINPTASGLEITSTLSPFAIGYSVKQTGGSSTPQGSSVWLTEPLTPTPTETTQPTTSDTVPTDIPTTQPTQTDTQSPGFGVLGIIAGLGAVAVLRRK